MTRDAKIAFFGRAAFPLHERAGDLSHGIELFFKIDAERKKVDAVPGLFRDGRGAHNAGFPIAHHAGAAGETREFPVSTTKGRPAMVVSNVLTIILPP